MDKNNNKILLVLAIMFFVLTINRFLPGDEQQEQNTEEYNRAYVEDETGGKLVLTREDLEMAEELSDYLTEEGIAENYSLDVECILQLPELPTGCEVTSLAIVLQYMGFQTDKVELADRFLKKSPAGTGTPFESFWGDPHSYRGFGCYAPVIVQCANDYFESVGIETMMAYDISGYQFEDLFAEIYAGNPVIIWSTINLEEPYVNSTWEINGETFEWKAPSHCVVMYGYDAHVGVVMIADPLAGKRIYSAHLFKDRYEKMYRQAVVIRFIEER